MNKPVTISIDDILLQRIKDEAARQNRSVSNYINYIINKELGDLDG